MVNQIVRDPAAITGQAAHWHALQREGGLNAQQQAEFMRWLLAAPAHLREYLAIARTACELGEAMRAMPIELDTLIGGEAAAPADNVVALPIRRIAEAPVAATGPRPRLQRFGAAAALLLGVAVAAHAVWPQSAHHVAAHGAPRSFELPDRTVVHLNADSELSLRFGLLRRRVELTRGQASFVVAADPRPFSVHAAGLQVQDIGTTFDVALQREQARIDVAEGRVRVFSETGAGRLLADLRAGQSARVVYRDHAVSVSHEDVDTMTAWWQRRIVFRDEPLRDVADRFNRLNAVHLQVDDAAAGALRLTGNLRGDDPQSLRAFLDQQPTLATTQVADTIIVRSRAADAGNAPR